MATSGLTISQLDRNTIIDAALRKIEAIAAGQTPSSEDYTNATEALNSIVFAFQTLGMPLWARREYSLTLVNGTSTYTIGTGQTTNTPFPQKLHQVIRVDSSSDSQIDVQIMSVYDWNQLPQDSSGSPVNVTYQPFVNYGVLKVWPAPDSNAATNQTLKLVYQRPLEYFNASTDTPDFPQEWQMALIYALAVALAPEWGVPEQRQQALERQANKYLDMVLGFGQEEASLFLQPNSMRLK
jgi:hypothetical protein